MSIFHIFNALSSCFFLIAFSAYDFPSYSGHEDGLRIPFILFTAATAFQILAWPAARYKQYQLQATKLFCLCYSAFPWIFLKDISDSLPVLL